MCGGAVGGPSLAGVDLGTAAVVQGRVVRDGAGVGGAYVRLLDASGEFTAEVVTSGSGEFRFFARPGDWTVRALAPGARGETRVSAAQGEVVETEVPVTG